MNPLLYVFFTRVIREDLCKLYRRNCQMMLCCEAERKPRKNQQRWELLAFSYKIPFILLEVRRISSTIAPVAATMSSVNRAILCPARRRRITEKVSFARKCQMPTPLGQTTTSTSCLSTPRSSNGDATTIAAASASDSKVGRVCKNLRIFPVAPQPPVVALRPPVPPAQSAESGEETEEVVLDLQPNSSPSAEQCALVELASGRNESPICGTRERHLN